MLTLIKNQKGHYKMMGKSLKINDQDIVVDSFEATDRGENIHFILSRTADNGASTNAIVSLFGKSSPVSIVDSDSKVAFTLSDGQISEYRFYTRDNQPALEYFKLEGNKIGVR